MKVTIGDRVRVSPHHWLRPNHRGIIAGFEPKNVSNHWLVEFDDPFVGGGIGGKSLYLSESQFEILRPRGRRGRA